MHKKGLAALADTYGLESAELHQLKLLSERFFDQFREELVPSMGGSIKMIDLSQRFESFVEFCNDPDAQHLAILGFGNDAVVAIRLDSSFAFALIASVLSSGTGTLMGNSHRRATTRAEEYILIKVLGDALIRVVARVFAVFFGTHSDLQMMRMEHRPGLISGAFAPAEQMVTAGVMCLVGEGGGRIAIALPVSLILRVRARLIPKKVKNSTSRALSKVRGPLGGATLELQGVLGRLSMSLDQVHALRPGSVLMLRKFGDGIARVELQCGGHSLFEGAVAEHRGWRRFVVHEKGGCND